MIKITTGLATAFLVAATAAATVAVAAQPTGSKGPNYSWVDKNGERHYGDTVPPEYAQSERRLLNAQGVEVQHIEATLSPQQLAERRKREQEIEQRAQHDHFLLTTYTSTRDIERLRDERLDQIDGMTKATNAYLETLDGRLTALQERAMAFKPYNTSADARRMPMTWPKNWCAPRTKCVPSGAPWKAARGNRLKYARNSRRIFPATAN